MDIRSMERESDVTAIRAFDRWAYHPATFAFSGLTEALRRVDPGPGAVVGDPFAGSARAGTRTTGRGQRFWGLEAHPLLGSLAMLKFARPGAEEDLLLAAQEVAAAAAVPGDTESEHQAITRMVHPDALGHLCAARSATRANTGVWREHLRWLLFDALRRSTGSGWPYRRATSDRRRRPRSVARTIIDGAQKMADDLRAAPLAPDAQVIVGDARTQRSWESVGPGGLDAVVSSPPYLNQISYLEATRLELLFEDPSATAWDLRERFGSMLMSSCTQQVTKGLADDSWDRLRDFSSTLVDQARKATTVLEEIRVEQGRQKIYDRLIPCYLADMVDVLRCQVSALVPGAAAGWIMGDSAPYGVYVDTPGLVATIATIIGYDVETSVKLRARGQRWTPRGRPARDLCERLVVMRRPHGGHQLSFPGL